MLRGSYSLRRALPLQLLRLGSRVRNAAYGWRQVGSWERVLRRTAERISATCLADVRDLDQWLERRQELRGLFREMLGLDALRSGFEPSSSIRGIIEHDKVCVEKVVLECLPGLYVTGNFYSPREHHSQLPCILYLCGHQVHPHGAKTQFQDRFLWYPANGFACLVLDSLQCGEVQGVHHGTRSLGMWEWLSLGYTPAGLETWNGMRAIDWLERRPEIDPNRIAVTGFSGGGVMTWFLAALDERVRVAAPSCSSYTIGSQVRRKLIPSQCDCTYFPNYYGLDFPALGALIAPRPLLIQGGRRDRIFPPEGFRELYRRVRRIYALFGDAQLTDERIQLCESGKGHADPPLFLAQTRAWMCRWMGVHLPPTELETTAPAGEHIESSDLRCFEKPPLTALNYGVHNSFIVPAALPYVTSGNAWLERREHVVTQLREKVFGWFPRTPSPFAEERSLESGGHAQRFSHFSAWDIETEPGVRIRVRLFEPHEDGVARGVVVIVRAFGDQVVFPNDELLPLLGDHVVLEVAPRYAVWAPTAVERSRLERTAAVLGRTSTSMQVWDVMRATSWVRTVRGLSSSAVTVIGSGAGAVVALYAAVLDEGIGHVVLRGLPASHTNWPPLLGVLRWTDVPEAAALIAPRPVTWVPGFPDHADFAQRIYQALGAADRIREAASLSEAVRGVASTGTCAGLAVSVS